MSSGPAARTVPLALRRCGLGPQQSYKGLTCWSLLDPEAGASRSPRRSPRSPRSPRWRGLAAALEDGFASVELSETLDDRFRVSIANRSPDPLVVIRGDEFPAARVGLCANASAWVPPRGAVEIEAAQLPRPSGRCAELVRALTRSGAAPDQIGFAAAIGGEVVGVECVATPALFGEVHATLLVGYAIEALSRERAPSGGRIRFDAPEPMLSALAGARLRPEPDPEAPLRVAAPGVIGRALCAAGALVHLSAFPIGV